MPILTAIYRLVIGPLQLFFEVLFGLAYKNTYNPGISILFLSLGMNLLVLPLYRRADAMQEQERQIQLKMAPWVKHIKKAFRGDERFMILQTYYRQNNYKPVYALRGSLSLLLEIPFFIAAFRFLSGLALLRGASFGPIRDLGAPDALLVIGGVTINVLPILMTVINLISGAIYTRGLPMSSKLQLYAMALVFLVFLYPSPSGLVLYWTLNNLFSLVKNIFYKLKDPGKVIRILIGVCGGILLVVLLFIHPLGTIRHQAAGIALALLAQVPWVWHLVRERMPERAASEVVETPGMKWRFFLGCLFLTILLGALIPSAVIRSSVQEFINIYYFKSPVRYVVSAILLAAGTFLLWFGVFFRLATPGGKRVMEAIVWIGAGVAIINYMFFGTNLGTLSSLLQFDQPMHFSMKEQLLNPLVLIALAAMLYLILRKWPGVVAPILGAGVLAILVMAGMNVFEIGKETNELHATLQHGEDRIPEITLSKDGKNVIVMMLDAGFSDYIPYIFHEKPELKEQFSGFTFYPNTIAHGGRTNFGSPALYGGYEYTPVEMNKRTDKLLGEKQNEALRVMPVLFDENDYRVTVCDPTYAGYSWIPDLSIYDDHPDIQAYITKGRYVGVEVEDLEKTYEKLNRDFFCYSLTKCAPILFQPMLYCNGLYNEPSVMVPADENAGNEEAAMSSQWRDGLSKAGNLDYVFMQSYTVLENLPAITDVADDSKDSFLMMSNDLPHDPILLQEPDYVPAASIDNTAYDAEHPDRQTDDGQTITLSTDRQVTHYHSNMATMLLLGKWLDYLKENGVYDNTRIIFVSDHGRRMEDQFEDQIFFDGTVDTKLYQALLMVKDFDEEGEPKTDMQFMTNADVPTLAMADLISNPINPATGKEITAEKRNEKQYIIESDVHEIDKNNGAAFLPGEWYSVHDDIFEESNWAMEAEPAATE